VCFDVVLTAPWLEGEVAAVLFWFLASLKIYVHHQNIAHTNSAVETDLREPGTRNCAKNADVFAA
jgi:hypothetical protein